MIVLGLNGTGQHGDHDAAACLLIDGRIAAFAEEERFTRRRHSWHSPAHTAAAACLAAGGLSVDDLDIIAYGWDLPRRLLAQGITPPRTSADIIDLLLPRRLFPRSKDPAVEVVQHHIAHAASAFYLSGAHSGPILVLDGQGENESITAAAGSGRDIKILRTWPIAASLGYFYEAACEFAGLGYVNAGKLMGLAPYGTARPGELRTSGEPDPAGWLPDAAGLDSATAIQARWLEHFSRVWPQPPNARRPGYDSPSGSTVEKPSSDPFEYRDFAATVQHELEAAVLRIVEDLLRHADGDVLHVAGGVGFNASMNATVLTKIGDKQLFVQPVAGDAGVALGAAAYAAVQAGDQIQPLSGDLGFGTRYSPALIRGVLDRSGLKYTEPTDPAREIANLIASGNVVGWFQGGAEAGPRALGSRSILASPASTRLRDHINHHVKQREPWRPFAPSIATDALGSMIDTSAGELPYMIITALVRDSWRQRLAGVTHVDGSTRPQTVSASTNPMYASLLDAVANVSGVQAILNTSFNGKNEPLVETPAQALTAFTLNGLDALAIGPFLVTAQRMHAPLGQEDSP